MAMVNIGGDAQDASYRYKMPRLVTKIEGRGNGIKTVIVNMVDIAKALHIAPGYPTKFFGIEFGAQSKFNDKTERAIVNGAHMQPDMAKMLDKFIDIFILCPTCRLPEIKMKVKKDRIKIDCAACGHNGLLTTKHKLLTYILKDHAEVGKDGKDKKKKDKKDKEKKKDKKDKKKKDEEAGEGDEDDDAEAPKEKKKDKKSKKDEEADVEWLTDTSKEAQKARKAAEFSNMKQNEKLDEILKTVGEDKSASTVLRVFLASAERNMMEIVSEMKRLQLARGLDEPQKVKVLLEAIIDTTQPKNVPQQFTANAALLEKATPTTNTKTVLLGCIEDLVGVVEPKLLPRVPMILQALYEADVLDEESLLGWHDAPPESSWLVNKEVASNVRVKAEPFINWLKEAESEEDE